MEQAGPRAPTLREGVEFRPLAAGRMLIYHPEAATQVCDARVGEALKLCNGQPLAELLPQLCHMLDYSYTEQEWLEILGQVADFGFFQGRPKRHPRVRLFDPGPVIEFLTTRCPWLFTAPTVAVLFVALFTGLWRLLSNWGLFVAETLRATQLHPLLTVLLFYFCFVPVGLAHELAHGIVCRWFGGDVVEVGVRKDSANLYVLSNTAPLVDSRMRILYLAGGPFLDMFIFFLLVNVWLTWPNYLTFMFLLPEALFFLQFSYAMEKGSDLSRIIAEWTGIRESQGRTAFLKGLFAARPKSATEWKRAGAYLASIALQTSVALILIWSFRRPVPVSFWPGFQLNIPFWPVLLYGVYRALRYASMNYSRLIPSFTKSRTSTSQA